MRRRVHLHGYLKDLHPGPISVVADSVADAVRIVSKQIPALRPNARTGYKRVQVAGCPQLHQLLAKGGPEDIHIMPAFCGGKRGGFLQIIIGALLIAASFIPGNPLAPLMMNLGITLMLGGILQLIQAPQRDRDSTAKTRYLGTPRNTVDIGTRIPILYGEDKIGGHYLSFNISAVDTGN